MKKDKQDLKSEIVINIGDNSYTVKFPDTGQLIDIEQAKASIPSPRNQTTSALWAYNLAIAIETFRIVIPSLQDDLNVKNVYKLSLLESQKLVEAYIRQFKPWFDNWIDIISDIFEDAEND
jgi:hypothetical protein